MDFGKLGEILLCLQRIGGHTGVSRGGHATIDDIGVELGELLFSGIIGLGPVEIPRNIFHAAVSRCIWSLFDVIHFLVGMTVRLEFSQSVKRMMRVGGGDSAIFICTQNISLFTCVY
jgi:hypothetical protein